MKRFLIAIILIEIGLTSGALFYNVTIFNSERNTAALAYFQLNQKLDEITNSRITVFAVGDIMLDRGVEYMIEKKGKGDFRFPFLKIAEELEKADFLFGNLEGPISTQGEKVGSIYSFRIDPQAVKALDYAGFDILSLANNHIFDYQRIALEETMEILKGAGIDYIGAGLSEEEAFSVKIKRIKGFKIGFLAYTNLGAASWRAKKEKSGIAWVDENDISQIRKEIREAKKKVDVLFVSLHSGWEYSFEPTDFQEEFSKASIEAGANIVLGHHPHVVQRVEEYRDGWIAHSLGNFVFDQGFSQETMKGLLLEITIVNGRIIKVNPREIKLSKYFQPYFP